MLQNSNRIWYRQYCYVNFNSKAICDFVNIFQEYNREMSSHKIFNLRTIFVLLVFCDFSFCSFNILVYTQIWKNIFFYPNQWPLPNRIHLYVDFNLRTVYCLSTINGIKIINIQWFLRSIGSYNWFCESYVFKYKFLDVSVNLKNEWFRWLLKKIKK